MSYNQEIEKMIVDAGATGPRITESGIKAKIDSVLYMRDAETALTVCKIQLKNGFSFVGHSAAADPSNYRQEIGDKIAYDNAFRTIWSHEGYLLKEVLYLRGLSGAAAADAINNAAADAAADFAGKQARAASDPTDSQAQLGQPAHD